MERRYAMPISAFHVQAGRLPKASNEAACTTRLPVGTGFGIRLCHWRRSGCGVFLTCLGCRIAPSPKKPLCYGSLPALSAIRVDQWVSCGSCPIPLPDSGRLEKRTTFCFHPPPHILMPGRVPHRSCDVIPHTRAPPVTCPPHTWWEAPRPGSATLPTRRTPEAEQWSGAGASSDRSPTRPSSSHRSPCAGSTPRVRGRAVDVSGSNAQRGRSR